MKTFSSPCEAAGWQQRDAHIRIVRSAPGREGARQMHGHIVPIATEIDRDVDPTQSRVLVALVPEGVVRGMLNAHLLPQASERLFAVI